MILKMKLFLFLIFLCLFCDAYKILLFFPYPVRSLNILGEGQARHLLRAGHEVTFVTAFPSKNPPKNLRQIDISSNNVMLEGSALVNISTVMHQDIKSSDQYELQLFAQYLAQLTFDNENVINFLSDPNEHFDAVIADLYECEIYAAIATLFNCPLVWSYSMGAHWQVLRLIDESPSPSYNADYISSNLPPFTFKQRLEELNARIRWHVNKKFFISPAEEDIYKKAFTIFFENRGKSLPSYQELIYNASLVLSNEHHAFGMNPATPQNFKFIGGQHIESQPKDLPSDLQSAMDNARDGVIYFSMGSTWQSKYIPKPVIDGLFKVFGELKQTVIWKLEEDLPNKPDNVLIVKWAPQPSILAHPNLRVFITHGGYLSTTEAVHFGVPVIGIPVTFDQFLNVRKAVAKGYALQVDLNFDLATNLRGVIQKIILDKTYKNKAEEFSAIYHDRAVPPGRELVHWVEHVIRTRGAPHLRSPALHVPLYQKLYLDLAALVLTAIYLIKGITKKLFSIKKKTTNEKKKKH